MYMEVNRLHYNPDGSLNRMYYNEDGSLKVSADEFAAAQKLYDETIRRDGIVEAWNEFHTKDWNYAYCQEWCEKYSANHKF